MLRLNILPEGYIYPRELRTVRDLMRKRMDIVQQSTKNLLSVQSCYMRHLGYKLSSNKIKQMAVPFARSGLFVDFPVHRSRNAQILLRQINGTIVPAGARVTVSPGKRSFLVGKRGEVYLMDLADSNKLSVQWQGGKCHLVLILDPSGPIEPRIGPLTCREEP
jgi:hypothetical protein